MVRPFSFLGFSIRVDGKDALVPAGDYMAQWRRENRERWNSYEREARERNRARIIEEYGGRCSCCGETELPFLTIEHMDGVPPSHRDKRGRRLSSGALYRQIIREGFPSNLTVLCWNCNMARAHYGACPHCG
jgi:hypothetical protein